MIKVALISPKGTFFSKDIKFREFWEKNQIRQFYSRFWSGLSTGLLIIGALMPKDVKCKLIDENLEPIDFDMGYDLIVLSAMTQQAQRAYQIADEFRRRNVKVVIGGIHATILPKEAKEHCDSVIVGEAEETWPQFINDFLKNNTQPFYFSTRSFDLEKSPIPKYELLNPENYKTIWIQTTRGCPHNCEFCIASRLFGTKFRHKSIKQVIKEVKLIKSIFKNPWIGFGDDNMFVNKKYAFELLEKLIPLKIRWMTQTDISIAKDKALLALLKKSGCRFLFIGFESVTRKSLESVDRAGFKIRMLDKYKDYIQKIQEAGMGIIGAFVLGFDYDDTTVFKNTAEFIINNHIYASQLTILTPLPGTRLRERLKDENRLLSFNWDNYTFWDVNFIPKHMSAIELQNGLLKVYKTIYDDKVLLNNVSYFKKIYSRNK
ncbi:MAG: cobalamin-dependent protein [Candidatus Gorgyraea atricola]|nr:cobalamin-dependent protein [Candidatus Gorgyraea atricola]